MARRGNPRERPYAPSGGGDVTVNIGRLFLGFGIVPKDVVCALLTFPFSLLWLSVAKSRTFYYVIRRPWIAWRIITPLSFGLERANNGR